MKLYIIGNGFDQAHDLKTSYWDFRCYLERYAEDFLIEFERLYSQYPYDPDEYHVSSEKRKEAIKRHNDALYNCLWKSFEASIGQPSECEFDTICDSTIDEMNELESGPIGIKDTLSQYFEEQFGFVTKLQGYLLKWAELIRLNKAGAKKNEIKNSRDLFLTFNYTPTLERVYGVPQSNICHIHGGIPPYCNTAPVIGHGNKMAIQKWKKLKQEYDNMFDEGGSSKCAAISNFYQRTLKDTDKYLTMNYSFFQKIRDVEEVVVIGHSLGEVDLPYFKKIIEFAGKDIPWTVVYHSESEKDNMENKVKELGVSTVLMIQSSDFWDSVNCA